MKAYLVVGPTKVQSRFFRSFDRATGAGEVAMPARTVRVSRFVRVFYPTLGLGVPFAASPAASADSSRGFSGFGWWQDDDEHVHEHRCCGETQ